MDALFPFGFPWPTAMYLSLFVITATIYVLFMNYVLAGAIVLLVTYLAPGARRRADGEPGKSASGLGQIARVIRDWLPAVLGLAITTGIAPLLFLQILYKRQFYTANLLLFNRFMLLLPALIVAYYMLYLIKSHLLLGKWTILRGSAAVVALACVLYTAWAWTENHVLSLHEETWTTFYSLHPYIYRNSEISPRLGYWITASFTTLALAVSWQLHWGRRYLEVANLDRATRRLRSLAILGLAMSAVEAFLWAGWLDPRALDAVEGSLALPYGFAAIIGVVIQAGGWLTTTNAAQLSTVRLAIISAGNVLTVLGAIVVREARRLAAIDITQLYDTHRHAAEVGGISVFLVFFALNAAVIAGCVLIVKRALRPIT